MPQKRYPINSVRTRGRPKTVPASIRKHLKVLVQEVTWLNHFHEVFRQFNDIVGQSPVNEANSEFWGFVRWGFGSELVHRVDRLCENQWDNPKRKVYSLYALMKGLLPYVSTINREYYVGICPNTVEQFRKKKNLAKSPQLEDEFDFFRLNEEFSRTVGKAKFSLPAVQVERDMRALRKATRKISRYRNKHLAHIAYDRARVKPPAFGQLDLAIKIISRLTHKYFLLIERGSHSLDFGSVDITSIFMKPWIIDQKGREALRKRFSERQSV